MNDRVRKAVERFRRETGIETVILFGSQSRGDAGPASDVDLLLVDERFRGQRFFERPVGLWDHWPRGIPVEFLCYTPEEVEDLRDQPTIVRAALEEGVRIGG